MCLTGCALSNGASGCRSLPHLRTMAFISIKLLPLSSKRFLLAPPCSRCTDLLLSASLQVTQRRLTSSKSNNFYNCFLLFVKPRRSQNLNITGQCFPRLLQKGSLEWLASAFIKITLISRAWSNDLRVNRCCSWWSRWPGSLCKRCISAQQYETPKYCAGTARRAARNKAENTVGASPVHPRLVLLVPAHQNVAVETGEGPATGSKDKSRLGPASAAELQKERVLRGSLSRLKENRL